ncbi:MAG: CaiB/BaiF CoA transferase family protein [Gammaproteobacteria bacterium]
MKPLEGTNVIDFTRVLAGPTCTRILAELGASVIKIEPPSGDLARAGSPTAGGIAGYFLQLNGGKRNLCIDLNWPEAREIVFDMCAKADVIVENFRPGTMTSFGLNYEAISAVNPKVVFVSMSGYGQNSPWSGRPAFATTVQAESGATATVLDHFGENLTSPCNDSSSHADLYTGLEGAIATLAGLNKCARTGKGTHADVSMMATMLNVNERLHAQINNLDNELNEPLALSAPDSPLFELADGSLVTLITSPIWSPAFARYCSMMGRNDLRSDPRFLTPDLRRKHCAELMAEVRAWMHTFRTFEELEAQVSGGGGLAVGRVRQPSEAVESIWAEAMQPTYEIEVGKHTVRLPKGPWLFDGEDSGALAPAAIQGAHNREVLAEAGVDAETIKSLYDKGVLHEASSN